MSRQVENRATEIRWRQNASSAVEDVRVCVCVCPCAYVCEREWEMLTWYLLETLAWTRFAQTSKSNDHIALLRGCMVLHINSSVGRRLRWKLKLAPNWSTTPNYNTASSRGCGYACNPHWICISHLINTAPMCAREVCLRTFSLKITLSYAKCFF